MTAMFEEIHGADYSFNRQWTVIECTRKDQKSGEKLVWSLTCGCGHESDYSHGQFLDPYAAAITAREYHQCSPNENPLDSHDESY
jgi:hypothetical protein